MTSLACSYLFDRGAIPPYVSSLVGASYNCFRNVATGIIICFFHWVLESPNVERKYVLKFWIDLHIL
jgi:hypothetical protein